MSNQVVNLLCIIVCEGCLSSVLVASASVLLLVAFGRDTGLWPCTSVAMLSPPSEAILSPCKYASMLLE